MNHYELSLGLYTVIKGTQCFLTEACGSKKWEYTGVSNSECWKRHSCFLDDNCSLVGKMENIIPP